MLSHSCKSAPAGLEFVHTFVIHTALSRRACVKHVFEDDGGFEHSVPLDHQTISASAHLRLENDESRMLLLKNCHYARAR